LREGAYVLVNGSQMELKGETGALIFKVNEDPVKVDPGADLSHLM